MSESLPSDPVVVHDVPEVENFNASFVYNFYTHDEAVLDSSGNPVSVTVKQVQSPSAAKKIPRYVKLSWKPVIPRASVSTYYKDNAYAYKGLISKNLNKIISEDFYTKSYRSIVFNDRDIVGKLDSYLSGTLEVLNLLVDVPKETATPSVSALKSETPTSVALSLSKRLPAIIDKDFVFESLKPKNVNYGDVVSKQNDKTNTVPTNDKLLNSRTQVRLNGIVANSLLLSSSKSTFSSYDTSQMITSANDEAQKYSGIETDIPYVYSTPQSSIAPVVLPEPIIIGYLIGKFDVTSGVPKLLDTLIVEGGNISDYIDANVAYGRRYDYRISAIAIITSKNNFVQPSGLTQTRIVDYLVQSKNVSSMVDTYENIAPPSPADLSFEWDYETSKLYIHWAFPANSQRDIKKFQVFRRDNTGTPFELLKVIDFNDSDVLWTDPEPLPVAASPGTLEKVTFPSLTYVDDDFKQTSLTSAGVLKTSKFIYTVCSVDAHGYSSNYGPQFEISFDVFENRLKKRLISHAGAPKSYPNLYLQADAFVDTIKVSGPSSKRFKLYFMPEYYEIRYNDQTTEKTVVTAQDGGQYKIQFVNLDMQESSIVSINIDDKRTTG